MSNLRKILGQKGIYYSDKCFNENFRILNERGKEIPNSEYDTITERQLFNYKIELINDPVTLKCGGIEYLFCDGENFSVVNGLIQRSLKGRFKITIFDKKHNKNAAPTDKIVNLIRYELKITGQFLFKNLNGDASYHDMNYFSTVEEARRNISFSLPIGLVTPDEITICDENQNPIKDPKRKLISIPNFENVIFYSIKKSSKYVKASSDENLSQMAINCYGDSNAITNYLVKKGLFYSDKSFKNKLHLIVRGVETEYNMAKSYKDLKESQIDFKNGPKIVTIDYNKIKFIFCDDEKLSAAYGLISRVFKNCLDVSIYDGKNNKLLLTSNLNKDIKYKVSVKCRFIFKTINGKGDNIQIMDYLSTVLDAKKLLSIILDTIDPEKIVLYDDNKNEIKDLELKLIDIPNYQKQIYCEIDTSRGSSPLCPPATQKRTQEIKSFAFSSYTKQSTKIKVNVLPVEDDFDKTQTKKQPKKAVKIKGPSFTVVNDDNSKPEKPKVIKPKESSSDDNESKSDSDESLLVNFEFNETGGKKFSPFHKRLKIDTTIKTLSEKIKKRFEIEEQVTISYKFNNSFCCIDDLYMNIDDIRDEMRVKGSDGKEQNFLYISIKKQAQKNKKENKKPDPVRKPKNDSNSDDDDTERIPSNKVVVRKPVPRKTSKDDDDDSVSHKPKKTFAPKTSLSILDSDSEDEKEEHKKRKSSTLVSDSEDEEIDHKTTIKSSDDDDKENEDEGDDDDDGYGKPANFRFNYDSTTRILKLPINSSLILNEEDIRNTFKIDNDDKIDFYVDEEMIEDKDTLMRDLQGKEIEIEIRPKPSKTKKKTAHSFKYIYLTNRDEDEHEIELDSSATVLSMKKKIADFYDVDNLDDLKIFFAGKDLLNNIVLKDLNIGEIKLFVHIKITDDVLEPCHKVIKRIGEGSSSITYKVIDTITSTYLCKKVLKCSSDSHQAFINVKNMMKEFEVLHKLNHPCICKAHMINYSEKVNDANIEKIEGDIEITTVALFLEFLDHKLSDVLKSEVNNTLKVRIVVEVAHAMNFLHKNGLIHRDLKIDNIMLNSVYEAKVVDFGLVQIRELFDSEYSFLNESMSKGVGTLAYMSPEMLNERDYDYKTDVYSFGIVLYFIFFGNLPRQSIKDKLDGRLIDLPASSPLISNFGIELIKRCLEFDPTKRPSFEDILIDIRKNRYLLASYIDQSVIEKRDNELKLFNKYNK